MNKNEMMLELAHEMISIAERMIDLAAMDDTSHIYYDKPIKEVKDKNKDKLLSLIKKSGKNGASKRDLLRRTQDISRSNREKLVQTLIDDGLIFEKQSKIEGSQRATTLYFWKK